MRALNIEQTKEMLIYSAKAIIDNKPFLTEVDAKIGDGDHGIGMEIGMQKAIEALDKLSSPASINEMYKTVGRAMMMSMGGASGIIFGTLFQGGVKAIPATTELDADGLRKLYRGALEAIKTRGGAQVGDKTMVDALEPAVVAMEECVSDELQALLAVAERAAAEGVEATKNFEAKFGRAKSLMSRSLGYQDAGATSTYIIFKAMHDFVSNI